tara:strand:+ start:33 stop:722 length:690 start_codon:yes stop_codon:yes gene_type:complete
MEKYLKHSVKKSLKERKEYRLYDIPVSILNPLPEHINIKDILEKIKEIIPYEICSDLEGIYIGEFSELKDRKIQAMFKEGAIYLSSFKDFPDVTDKIIINDIIHELAHMFEDNSYFEIYDDDSIENEYVGKKKKLVALLRANDISFAGMGKLFFSDEFVDELDDFLFNNLGYDNLALLTAGLFMSPYSVTSIREYFANGFEEYINGDQNYLKDISPALYNKLENVLNME